MSKSALFGIIFLTALLSFMVWKGYLELPSRNAKIDMAVPEDAAFSFKIEELTGTLNLLKTAKYNNDLNINNWYTQLIDGLVLIQNCIYDDAYAKASAIAAYQYVNEEQGSFLFVIDQKNTPHQPFKLFRKIITNTEEFIETNKVGNTTMYSADVNTKGFSKLTFATHNGIILFSKTPKLVEESLKKLNNIASTFTKGHRNTNTAIKTIQVGLKLNFFDRISNPLALSNFSDVETLNAKLYLFENGVIANGELIVKKGHKINILAKHATNNLGTILKYVPNKASYFEKYKVDNLLNYVVHQIENESVTLPNTTEDFIKCLGNEWVSLKYDNSEAPYYIFVVEDAIEIQQFLDVKTGRIKQFDLNKLLANFGNNTAAKSSYFFKLNNDVLTIGTNEKILNELVNDIKQKRSFILNKTYQQYEPKLYKNNFCLIYSNAINTTVKNNFGPLFYQIFTIEDAIFSNAVFAYKNEGLTNKVNFEYKPAIIKAETISGSEKWENIVGQKITNGPDVFKNHYTGENEFIVQDDRNNLYLIDKQDSIIWQRKISNKYLGKINVIDFYTNNKLQILLNTKNEIYLIDRKGRDVENFPVIIEEATNGLTVIKYADVGKLRYYLATVDNVLKAFDKNGKAVKGWKLPRLSGEVKLPIKHLIANNKDYLCATTKSGTIYLFTRDGRLRQQPFGTNLNEINAIEVIIENENKYILASNKNNSVKVVLE